MIAILDYGMGNLRSVEKAFGFLGLDAEITSDRRKIQSADKIVLPGVGAFADAIKALSESGLDRLICERVKAGVYLMGICLGMQLLATKSYENGEYEGLNIIGGEVKKFDVPLKIPHIGWNDTIMNMPSKVYEDGTYYFVHSYHFVTDDRFVAAYSDYGGKFVAAVQKDNVFASQFHPEKSGEAGLKILKKFGELK